MAETQVVTLFVGSDPDSNEAVKCKVDPEIRTGG